jgi:hypothetical protein
VQCIAACIDRPTIIDIARLAGVSKKTVSRVINNSPLLSKEAREKVERIIAETGFVPNQTARGLALKRNFLIALVHDNELGPALVEVQAGMVAALKDSEFRRFPSRASWPASAGRQSQVRQSRLDVDARPAVLGRCREPPCPCRPSPRRLHQWT